MSYLGQRPNVAKLGLIYFFGKKMNSQDLNVLLEHRKKQHLEVRTCVCQVNTCFKQCNSKLYTLKLATTRAYKKELVVAVECG